MSNSYVCTAAGCELAKGGGLVSFPLVTVAGLVDSLNPCAITIIILLLTYLIIFAKKPERVLKTGLIYISAVFLTYLALGLFFYQTISQISQIGEIKFYINKILGVLLIAAGVINTKDFFWPERGPHLEVPQFARSYLESLTKRVSYSQKSFAYPMTAFLGVAATVLGSPCSLPIYVGTIHILAQSGLGTLGVLGYFLYYNFLFTLPLSIILIVVWKGSELRILDLQDFQHRGKRWMKLGLGLMLLGMGGWLIGGVRISPQWPNFSQIFPSPVAESTPTTTQVLLPTVSPVPSPVPTATATPSPQNNQFSYRLPVLILKYFPPDPYDQNKIDRTVTGTDLPEGTTVEQLRQKITVLNSELINSLQKGSSFHGYQNAVAKPVLNYSILEEKEFLKPVPVETVSDPKPADHQKILKEENFDICDYVENKAVKEVWLWMYHSGQTSPVESYQRGPFGGVGNGFMNLPLCRKTYTVYDYNYGRGVAEALEDHTHHFEALFRQINNTIWDKFVGGANEPFACGWTHCPPNVMAVCANHQYDWKNETVVKSDCEDWRRERDGQAKEVSCHTWDGANCTDNGGVNFKIWWMQNLPQAWWEFIGDFDTTMKLGKTL